MVELRTPDDKNYPYDPGPPLCFTGLLINSKGKLVAAGRGSFTDRIFDEKEMERYKALRRKDNVETIGIERGIEDGEDVTDFEKVYLDYVREAQPLDEPKAAGPASANNRAADITELSAGILEGVVKIRTQHMVFNKGTEQRGSGVVFAEDESYLYILSAAHIANPDGLTRDTKASCDAEVILADQTTVKGEVIADSYGVDSLGWPDIGLVRVKKEDVKDKKITVVPLANPAALKGIAGKKAFVLGYGQGQSQVGIYAGIVEGFFRDCFEHARLREERTFTVAADTPGGVSGGPIIYEGKIFGIVGGCSPKDKTTAVSVDTILNALRLFSAYIEDEGSRATIETVIAKLSAAEDGSLTPKVADRLERANVIRGSLLAPGSRFGRNSVEVDVILSRIDRLLPNYPVNDRRKQLIYLQQLKLLRTLGLLRRDTKVFYPLSGIDFFPALFVDRIWTADGTFSKEWSWRLFCELWKAAEEDHQNWQADEEMPSLEGCGKITHDCENVQHETLVRRWTSQMRSGDMVFLKFTRDCFIAYGDSGDRKELIKRWMKHFVELIPEGVNIVVIEGIGGNNVFDRGLTNYLLETNLVEDIAPSLLSAQQLEQLRVINWKSEQHVEKVADTVDFMSGGALSILKKTSLAPGSRVNPERSRRVEEQRIQEMPDMVLVTTHREALKRLSFRERMVLTKLFVEGRSYAQVAQECRSSIGRVRSLKQKGLESLRRLLNPVETMFGSVAPAPITPMADPAKGGKAADRLKKSGNIRGSS